MPDEYSYHRPRFPHSFVCALVEKTGKAGETFFIGHNGNVRWLVTPIRNPKPGRATHVLQIAETSFGSPPEGTVSMSEAFAAEMKR